MTDPRFFVAEAPLTVAEIAESLVAELPPGTDPGRPIAGVAPLDMAGPEDATFFDNVRFAGALERTRAGLCFCRKADATRVPAPTVALAVAEPQRAFALLAMRLYPAAVRPTPVTGKGGVSHDARVDPTARLEAGVTVEPGAVVGPGAEIGRDSLIGPGAVIGPAVRIGRAVVVSAQATVTNALVGNRVVIHPGARIGQDGFGYVPGQSGHTKVPQLGRVIIQDDVEIGANTTIDRGSSRDTIVGEGTKVDNLVQVAHNVVIGRHCLIAGQVGISGSVTIGDFVMIGGQAGIRDNVTIGNGAQIAAMAGVSSDVPAGERWVGIPAEPMAVWRRRLMTLRRLGRGQGVEGGSGEEGEPGDG